MKSLWISAVAWSKRFLYCKVWDLLSHILVDNICRFVVSQELDQRDVIIAVQWTSWVQELHTKSVALLCRRSWMMPWRVQADARSKDDSLYGAKDLIFWDRTEYLWSVGDVPGDAWSKDESLCGADKLLLWDRAQYWSFLDGAEDMTRGAYWDAWGVALDGGFSVVQCLLTCTESCSRRWILCCVVPIEKQGVLFQTAESLSHSWGGKPFWDFPPFFIRRNHKIRSTPAGFSKWDEMSMTRRRDAGPGWAVHVVPGVPASEEDTCDGKRHGIFAFAGS